MGRLESKGSDQPLPLGGRVTAKRTGGVVRARELRCNMTDAEWKMWHILRDIDWPGAHFRRQAKIGPFYADFLSHSYKLIIEVDGAQHYEDDAAAIDERRTRFLNREGFKVIRFGNIDVLKNSAGVFDAITDVLKHTIPTPRLRRVPSPQGGGSKVPDGASS
jgi:very-short-patch-repair endonuclease